MRFEINLRDKSSYEIEASYIEVTDGPVNSSFTLVGPVPGYPTAILAAFPVDKVESVLPALESPREGQARGVNLVDGSDERSARPGLPADRHQLR